ncbi:aconitase family protein [Candidatus Palauibacter polyketidifaciens]|uniref:aconitase family protein n=1 Tax=Candidatus Palauibacter polyketidifaciens TaxID=3056740 RepID=UPI00139EBBD7|nr:aconitase family protein [Candidatus Palauibacter polyketidifaciens]MDE2721720.1 aconitase family protein [Candidatus Palauibacter polyketidifaciens]MYE34014.1 3-isopropylmalate dehydratase [Gemmatimonadales bacterium]
MLEHLLETEVAKRPPTVRLQGRILFLTEDPDLIRRQLAGEDLEWDPSIPLRDDISTDEITPGWVCYHFDEKLGEYPYVGLLCGDERPIGRNDIRKGGFVCSVSGKRRGKGSSREASPYAERAAGLRVVIGENIERIYGENCANIGLLASTDFSLIEKIRNGEEIPLDAFIGDAGRIQRDIIEYGGLLDYAVARLKGLVTLPAVATPADRPQTIAEKIIARHWVTDAASGALGVPAVKPGDTGFLRADLRFSHEYVTPMASTFWEDFAGDAGLNHTESIVFFRDHLAFLDEVITEERKAAGLLDAAHALHDRQREFAAAKGVRLHGELPDRTGSEGICHIMVQDRYALPGQIIIGSDSHTPHSGALGCVAFGVGTSAIVNAWATRDVRLEVPESIRVNITGQPPPGVVAKDLILELLRHPTVKSGEAIGRIIEFTGEAVEALSIDERATLTNMAAEVGGFTGVIAPDEKAVGWIAGRRGVPAAEVRALCDGLHSDAGANYAATIEMDAGGVEPMVATPGDPGNGLPISALEGDVSLDTVFVGACTGAKRADFEMYAGVAREAVAAGKRVPATVRAYAQYGSIDVEAWSREQGHDQALRDAGFDVLAPGCGACINAGPGVSTTAEQVTISSINRNFPGRSGPGQVYLASPLTCVASAIEGRIVAYGDQEWSGEAGSPDGAC